MATVGRRDRQKLRGEQELACSRLEKEGTQLGKIKKSSLEVTQVNLILESEHEASLLWGTKAGKQAEQALCSPAVTTKAEASAVLQ